MDRIVECVPNFSEGRNTAVIDELAQAVSAIRGVALLDRTMDADHHRAVLTFAGAPEAVLEAALEVARLAVARIDLNHHRGEHPRIGALDVLPFVPLRGVTMEDCVALARAAGERLWRELSLPVYLYERAATRPERADLAVIRRGGFELLREEIIRDPTRRPDFGEPRLHPTAGAVAVGARKILVAFNVNLATEDLSVARRIARAVRGRDGGLRYVKALGFALGERGLVQVSMNLVDYAATPIHRAFELVRREAARYGVAIAGSEIVGLVPQAALEASAEYFLQLENFSPRLVLENRLAAALRPVAPSPEPALEIDPLARFSDEIASGAPTPGGGSVAAAAGALSGALGAMVCRLMIGRARFAAVEVEARELLSRLESLRTELAASAAEDAAAYDRVGEARRLPQESEANRLARASAIEESLKGAVAVPLGVAGRALEILELLEALYEIAPPAARSDLAVGAELARASIRGAYYNVMANLEEIDGEEIGEEEFAAARRAEIAEILARGNLLAATIDALFHQTE